MNKFHYKKMAVLSACTGALLLMLSSASFAAKKWELIIWTNNVSYLASYTSRCSGKGCRIKMCGRRVYVVGGARVLASYRKGYKVVLKRDTSPYKTLCTAKR